MNWGLLFEQKKNGYLLDKIIQNESESKHYLTTFINGIIAYLLFKYFNKTIDHRFVKIDARQNGNWPHHTVLQTLEVHGIDADEELIDTGPCWFYTDVHKLYGIRWNFVDDMRIALRWSEEKAKEIEKDGHYMCK